LPPAPRSASDWTTKASCGTGATAACFNRRERDRWRLFPKVRLSRLAPAPSTLRRYGHPAPTRPASRDKSGSQPSLHTRSGLAARAEGVTACQHARDDSRSIRATSQGAPPGNDERPRWTRAGIRSVNLLPDERPVAVDSDRGVQDIDNKGTAVGDAGHSSLGASRIGPPSYAAR